MQDLLDKQAAIEADPRNRMPAGGLYRYTPCARKKLDAITRRGRHETEANQDSARSPKRIGRSATMGARLRED